MGRGPDLKPRKKTGRPGPGRPKGIPEALPRGAVAATRAMRHTSPRVEGLDPEEQKIANEAFDVYVDVMRAENPHRMRYARERLGAARMVREEICGPIAQRFEHEHRGGVTLQIATGFQGEPGHRGELDDGND